jgi:hypothetical protein
MAAGLGFKTFNTGDVLSASDTNGYLMQGVLVFANAAARDAAITSPQEGQCCYLKDTDAVQTYSGSAWVGFDDSNAIQNSIVDAKGDIVAASGNDTPARLAVGSNGDTLVADSATATGLRYIPLNNAGKNGIINGGMDIWQRGTSSTLANGYGSVDRWYQYIGSGSGTYAQESTVVPAGTRYSMKFTSSAAGTSESITQYIETSNAIIYAGKTITVSAQVAASTSTAMNFIVQYSTTVDAGTAASWTSITATAGGTATPTSTTFVTMSGQYAVPSNAASIRVIIGTVSTIASGVVLYRGAVQLELGSTATTFSRAGGTIQGELAACQRYYYRATTDVVYGTFPILGFANATTTIITHLKLPVTMRVKPSSIEYPTISTIRAYDGVTTTAMTSVALSSNSSQDVAYVDWTVASGLTQYRPYLVAANNSASAYVGVSAEL